MDSSIGRVWNSLYSNNPKLQAFGVNDGREVLWQTSNWNLVEEMPVLLEAIEGSASEVQFAGVLYQSVVAETHRYAASASGNGGHLIMARIKDQKWALAWALSDSVPQLALIDLEMAAIDLKDEL